MLCNEFLLTFFIAKWLGLRWFFVGINYLYGLWGIAWWGINVYLVYVFYTTCTSTCWIDNVLLRTCIAILYSTTVCGVDLGEFLRHLNSEKNCPAFLLPRLKVGNQSGQLLSLSGVRGLLVINFTAAEWVLNWSFKNVCLQTNFSKQPDVVIEGLETTKKMDIIHSRSIALIYSKLQVILIYFMIYSEYVLSMISQWFLNEGHKESGLCKSPEYSNFQYQIGLFVCLFVCSFVEMIFPSRELGKLPHRDINTKLATANLSYKDRFNVNDYELHKSRNCDSVTRLQYLF